MEEEKTTASGGGGGESSRVVSPKMLKSGDRQLFTVEIRPGETTYVSWKKLVRDANRVNGPSASVPDPPPNAHPNLQSRIAPGQSPEKDMKDEPPPNRFSAVIEKIERLYMGKDSSDEEELDDAPDDDQYDTEDSFIDDAELDEYFEVDNSAIKHDGFFVNRGKLERIYEPAEVPHQQPKKRRRKDLSKSHGESDEGRGTNKHVKVAKMAAGRTDLSLAKSSSNPSQNLALTNENYGDVKAQNQLNFSGTSSRKKSSDSKMTPDPSSQLKVLNGDTSVSIADVKDVEKTKTGAPQSKGIVGNKVKDASVPDVMHQKYVDKNAYAQSKFQHGKTLNNLNEFEQSIGPREKNGNRELPDINVSEGKYPMQTTQKASHWHRRDGSAIRPKSSMLERAIRELEKLVAESRPPTMENQEVDPSSQGVKRRLPREIKMKLSKVAKLAQTSQGKVSKELLNRLMSILGHLIQLRTLKRNLKIMINSSLSAKQEKDDRFQQIKKEVVEMIKIRIPHLESKAFEQQAGASDDFQEIGSEDKVALKRKFIMDTALEDKICDLYDFYVDGLDEDVGPQVRKFYAELAELWPSGLMDNHGIKRAICKAKDRRRSLYSRNKDQEKIKRKKMLGPRLEENVRVDGNSSAHPQNIRERMAIDSGTNALTPANKPIPSTNTSTVRMPSPSNSASFDRLKQEKLKGSPSNTADETKTSDGSLPKKKLKRKPELEFDETRIRPEKLSVQQSDERPKSIKQAANLPQKSSFQSAAAPSFDQSS